MFFEIYTNIICKLTETGQKARPRLCEGILKSRDRNRPVSAFFRDRDSHPCLGPGIELLFKGETETRIRRDRDHCRCGNLVCQVEIETKILRSLRSRFNSHGIEIGQNVYKIFENLQFCPETTKCTYTGVCKAC